MGPHYLFKVATALSLLYLCESATEEWREGSDQVEEPEESQCENNQMEVTRDPDFNHCALLIPVLSLKLIDLWPSVVVVEDWLECGRECDKPEVMCAAYAITYLPSGEVECEMASGYEDLVPLRFMRDTTPKVAYYVVEMGGQMFGQVCMAYDSVSQLLLGTTPAPTAALSMDPSTSPKTISSSPDTASTTDPSTTTPITTPYAPPTTPSSTTGSSSVPSSETSPSLTTLEETTEPTSTTTTTSTSTSATTTPIPNRIPFYCSQWSGKCWVCTTGRYCPSDDRIGYVSPSSESSPHHCGSEQSCTTILCLNPHTNALELGTPDCPAATTQMGVYVANITNCCHNAKRGVWTCQKDGKHYYFRAGNPPYDCSVATLQFYIWSS